MIDHHLEPEDFDDYRYWDVTASATAQLVYKFIVKELGHKELVNKDVATCLYTGIMTDSASFCLPNTTSEVHRITADLIDAGAVNWQIYDLVYNNSSRKPATLFRRLFIAKGLRYCMNIIQLLSQQLNGTLKKYSIATGRNRKG